MKLGAALALSGLLVVGTVAHPLSTYCTDPERHQSRRRLLKDRGTPCYTDARYIVNGFGIALA